MAAQEAVCGPGGQSRLPQPPPAGGVEKGSASDQEEKNIQFWLNQSFKAQSLVTGELHITWRIQTTLNVWAGRAVAWLKRRVPWVKETEGEERDGGREDE